MKRSIGILGLAALGLLLALGRSQGAATISISGVVRLVDGRPAVDAWVRVQTTANLVHAASDGAFTLGGLTSGMPITVTAWYPDYKVGWAAVTPADGVPSAPITITLRPYDTRDDPTYAWNTSYPDPANTALGCGHCMAPSFAEWSDTAHAGSGTNRRFFSLYNGTDLSGAQPVAPGYQQDFPGTTGNCATCHAPGAAYDAPFTTNMNDLSGVNREGVFCEFCHKVGDVYLDPTTGRPYNNAPGVLSMRLYRPYPGDQLFFGSLDDVARRVSYLPLERQSRFCAPCHQFSFWGTPIYQSFREWQESPYPARGIECQTCHMPPGESPTFCLPSKGGLARDPTRMASHRDLGLKDAAFMQSTVAMTLTASAIADTIRVEVTLTNANAGHHVPTDFPGRNMILTVAAADEAGSPLALLAGPTVPAWGGSQAGQAGVGYAKVLRDLATGEAPVVNYWKQTEIVSDNRIPALGSDLTAYSFAAPQEGGQVEVVARLVFRRVFSAVDSAKGWNSTDTLMVRQEAVVDAGSRLRHYLPLLSGNEHPRVRLLPDEPVTAAHGIGSASSIQVSP
jgi:hypothetical protein